jgi:hypothetical protein
MGSRRLNAHRISGHDSSAIWLGDELRPRCNSDRMRNVIALVVALLVVLSKEATGQLSVTESVKQRVCSSSPPFPSCAPAEWRDK